MEHNHLKIIQAKVRAQDNTPIQWNREKVWNAVTQRKPRRHIFWYYSAAAAILVIGIGGYLTFDHGGMKSDINPSNTDHTSTKHDDPTIGDTRVLSKRVTSHRLKPLQKHSEDNTTPLVDTTKIVAQQINVTDSIQPVIDDTVAIAQENQSTNTEPVHAIFGVEETKYTTIKLKGGKRIRVQIFSNEGEMQTSAGSEASTNLLTPLSRN